MPHHGGVGKKSIIKSNWRVFISNYNWWLNLLLTLLSPLDGFLQASPTEASKTVEEKASPKPNEKEMKKPVIYMSETKASEKTDDGKTFKQYADTFAKTGT